MRMDIVECAAYSFTDYTPSDVTPGKEFFDSFLLLLMPDNDDGGSAVALVFSDLMSNAYFCILLLLLSIYLLST